MSEEFVKVETHNDVLVLRIDNPPVNALSQRMVLPLQKLISEAQQNNQISGIVVTGTGKFFVSGADIKEFSKPSKGVPIPQWFDQLELSKKPIVFAINGFALGGGLELAMSGHYRVALPSCGFGLVELQLGIIPGAGGTQRLPRLIGVKRATEMMLNASQIKASEALKLGLVDEVLQTPEELIAAAIKAAKTLAGKKELRVSSQLSDKLGPLWQEEQTVNKILAQMDKQGKTRNQIHFKMCADAIVTGITRGSKVGLKREWNNFLKCLTSNQARGLMNIFFSQRTSAVVPGITDRKDFTPAKIKLVAVLGGGTMGSGIATWLLLNGYTTYIKEINSKACDDARKRVEGNLTEAVKRGKLSVQQAEQVMKRLVTVDSYSDFKKIDLVIEAIFENIELKQNTFYDLEQSCRQDCILASNTSTISLDVITKRMKHKGRVIGVHFFAPAHVMPLVEVIRNEDTTEKTVYDCVNFIKNAKKIVVVVKNCVGFLVNRIFMTVSAASGFLVGSGVDLYRIDRAMTKYGMALGPFRTADLSGLDIGSNAYNIMFSAYGDRLIKTSLQERLIKEGRLGEKTKSGYYLYKDGKALEDPSIKKFIEQSRDEFRSKNKNIPEKLEITDEEIADLIVFGIINEACRTLDEGITIRMTDVDVASVFGMGYPSYRGGVMNYGKTVGFKKVAETLDSFYKKYSFEFFKPSPYLVKLASQSKL